MKIDTNTVTDQIVQEKPSSFVCHSGGWVVYEKANFKGRQLFFFDGSSSVLTYFFCVQVSSVHVDNAYEFTKLFFSMNTRECFPTHVQYNDQEMVWHHQYQLQIVMQVFSVVTDVI